jgi:hypothetical protein
MTKRLSLVLLLALSQATILLAEVTEKPTMAVAVASLTSGYDERSQTIAREMITALETILVQLGGYTISRVDTATERTARRVSEGYDLPIYGSMESIDGTTRIGLSVFSHAAGGVTQAYQRDISSVFEIFGAADEAAIEILEGLSGTTIRFARAVVQDERATGTFYFVIDHQEPPRGVTETRVLTGTRRIQVVQDRMIERFILFDRLEFLPEDVSFSPELTDEGDRYRARHEFEAQTVLQGTQPHNEAISPRRVQEWIVGLRAGLGPEALNDGPRTEELSLTTSLHDDAEETKRSIATGVNGVRLFAAWDLFSWISIGAELGYSRKSVETEILRDTSPDGTALTLDGKYLRSAVLHRIESGEMTVHVEPRVYLGWGISAGLRYRRDRYGLELVLMASPFQTELLPPSIPWLQREHRSSWGRTGTSNEAVCMYLYTMAIPAHDGGTAVHNQILSGPSFPKSTGAEAREPCRDGSQSVHVVIWPYSAKIPIWHT